MAKQTGRKKKSNKAHRNFELRGKYGTKHISICERMRLGRGGEVATSDTCVPKGDDKTIRGKGGKGKGGNKCKK